MQIVMSENELAVECFRVIRREVRDFERETTDAELGNFVRGVVELETCLYSMQERKNFQKELTNANSN